MTYPQYPAPGAPSPYPAQAAPAQRVSGATAIAAGVLAILGGLWAGIAAVINMAMLDRLSGLGDFFFVWTLITIVLRLVIMGLLIGGAIMMFMRKTSGRMLVIIGCGVVIVSSLADLIIAISAFGGGGRGAIAGGIIGISFVVLPAIITLVLSMLSMTVQWLKQGKPAPAQAGYPQPGGFGQGYPQSGGIPQSGGLPQSGGFAQPGHPGQAPYQPGQPPRQW